jgi:glyoxylase I family protein
VPVTGIGGVFFRAKDPAALMAWYKTHLGVTPPGAAGVWQQEAGPTVFMPFSETTDYFPADKQWMVNFRVSELDALVEQLRASGIDCKTDPAWDSPETGRFARISDPEGTQIELWEPPVE